MSKSLPRAAELLGAQSKMTRGRNVVIMTKRLKWMTNTKMVNLQRLVFSIAFAAILAALVLAAQPQDKPQQSAPRSPDRQRGGPTNSSPPSSSQRQESSESGARSQLQQPTSRMAVAAQTSTSTTRPQAQPTTLRTYHNHRRDEQTTTEPPTSVLPDEDLSPAASSANEQPPTATSDELSEPDEPSGAEPATAPDDGVAAAEEEADEPAPDQEWPESRVGVAAGPIRRESPPQQAQSRSTTTTTTTSTTSRPTQFPSTRTRQPTLISSTIASRLNVDMGADKMMIKPPQQTSGRSPQWPPTNAAAAPSTENADEVRSPLELATESVVNHVLVSARGGDGQPPESRVGAINERHQNMLFPSVHSNQPHQDEFSGGGGGGQPTPTQNSYQNQLQQDSSALVVAGICYTPLALLMVILITMAITVAVCFCAHFLIRHLSRRQFGK